MIEKFLKRKLYHTFILEKRKRRKRMSRQMSIFFDTVAIKYVLRHTKRFISSPIFPDLSRDDHFTICHFQALRNRARKARANRKPNLGDIKPGSIIENIAHTRR